MAAAPSQERCRVFALRLVNRYYNEDGCSTPWSRRCIPGLWGTLRLRGLPQFGGWGGNEFHYCLQVFRFNFDYNCNSLDYKKYQDEINKFLPGRTMRSGDDPFLGHDGASTAAHTTNGAHHTKGSMVRVLAPVVPPNRIRYATATMPRILLTRHNYYTEETIESMYCEPL